MRSALKYLTVAATLAFATTAAMAAATDMAKTNPNADVDGLKSKFIDVNGVNTRYYDYGQGDVILLVHGGSMGGSSTANNWSRNIPELAKNHRVIAVDRLAQGMTGNPKDDKDFTNPGAVKHLRQFVETMKLDRFDLVGHSSGGGITFYYSLEYPQSVKTLTVLSAGPQQPPAGEGPTKFDEMLAKECSPDTESYEHRLCRLVLLGHTPGTFSEEYAQIDEYMGMTAKSKETRARMDAMRAKDKSWPASVNNTYRDQAWDKARKGGLQMPILILTAKQDTLSWDADEPFAMMRRELGFMDIVATKNAKVKMVILNEAGHFPYRDQVDQFNDDLLNFIKFWNK